VFPEDQSESEVVALDDETGQEDESAETVARPLKKRKTTVAPEEEKELDLDTGEEQVEACAEEETPTDVILSPLNQGKCWRADPLGPASPDPSWTVLGPR
jgi:hypothetical protein